MTPNAWMLAVIAKATMTTNHFFCAEQHFLFQFIHCEAGSYASIIREVVVQFEHGLVKHVQVNAVINQ